MKRGLKRTFLLSMLMVAISLQYCTSPKPAKDIGVQLWSVRHAMNPNPDSTLKVISEMGYTFIEAAGYDDGKFYGMEPAEFKALLEENGLVMLSSHTGSHFPDSAEWESTMQWWDKAIDAHLAAGADYIVIPSTPKEFKDINTMQRYCDFLNTVGEKCKTKGLLFGLHNHKREFKTLNDTVIYNFLVENTNPEFVFFQMDLYWITDAGADPVKYFEKYPGRFTLWHVKDEAAVGASGKIDFKRIFENEDQSGVKEIIVEVEVEPENSFEEVKKSIEFLQEAEYVQF